MIGTEYGPTYLPASANVYKSKKDAQEAHRKQCAQPRAPDSGFNQEIFCKKMNSNLQADLAALLASQMNPAVFDQTTVTLTRKSGADMYWFR